MSGRQGSTHDGAESPVLHKACPAGGPVEEVWRSPGPSVLGAAVGEPKAGRTESRQFPLDCPQT